MSLTVGTTPLLTAVIATGAGQSRTPEFGIFCDHSFQLFGQTSAGAGAAAVDVQVSNDNTNWITQRTISLTLSASTTTDGYVDRAIWKYVRGNVTSISGTNAAVTLLMGVIL